MYLIACLPTANGIDISFTGGGSKCGNEECDVAKDHACGCGHEGKKLFMKMRLSHMKQEDFKGHRRQLFLRKNCFNNKIT